MKNKKESISKRIVNLYASNYESLSGISKTLLGRKESTKEEQKVSDLFRKFIESKNIPASKINAKNLSYFLPVENLEKVQFSCANVLSLVRQMAKFAKTGEVLNSTFARKFQLSADIARLTDNLAKIDIEIADVKKELKADNLSEVDTYLLNVNLTEMELKRIKKADTLALAENMLSEIG